MDCPINRKRFLIGGFSAAIWVLICEGVVHGHILMPRYEALAKMGLTLSKPSYNFCPVWILYCIGIGHALSWLYATARGTFKPGPMTAVKVGLFAWFLMAVPENLADWAWLPIGKFVPFVKTVGAFFECVGGALIAGAIYKPKSN